MLSAAAAGQQRLLLIAYIIVLGRRTVPSSSFPPLAAAAVLAQALHAALPPRSYVSSADTISYCCCLLFSPAVSRVGVTSTPADPGIQRYTALHHHGPPAARRQPEETRRPLLPQQLSRRRLRGAPDLQKLLLQLREESHLRASRPNSAGQALSHARIQRRQCTTQIPALCACVAAGSAPKPHPCRWRTSADSSRQNPICRVNTGDCRMLYTSKAPSLYCSRPTSRSSARAVCGGTRHAGRRANERRVSAARGSREAEEV